MTVSLILISPGGYPNDQDLITSLKALACLARINLKDTVIILVAQCPEGLDSKKTITDEFLVSYLKKSKFNISDWPLLLVQKLLKNNRLFLLSEFELPSVKKIGFKCFSKPDTALNEALSLSKENPMTWIIPNGNLNCLEH